jgi:Tol biopolymer transport system component
MQTKVEDGRWTRPDVAPFSANPDYMSLEPFISPDGQKLYFLSNRPRDGGVMGPENVGAWVNQDIWVTDRTANGWGEPYNLGPPVNSDDEEYFPSVTRDGTIYFTRTPSGTRESYIYRSRLVDGQYTEPERLGPEVNSTGSQFNAFVAPDESYLILSVFGREDSMGSMDYYIVFRSEEDEWSQPINMGEQVNTPRGGEFSPYVSPDGKYFFFMSTRSRLAESMPERLSLDFLQEVFDGPQNGNSDIYWIEAGFIEDLRRAAAEESTE